MLYPCKQARIQAITGEVSTFRVGSALNNSSIISHLTVDFDKKIVMIRDKNNFKKILSYTNIEVDVDPNSHSEEGMDVFNLI